MGLTYDIVLESEVHAARHTLPGHVRQRIHRLIDDLSANPRPLLAARSTPRLSTCRRTLRFGVCGWSAGVLCMQ